MKEKFLPMILRNDVEFAVGYSEPNAGLGRGVDAAEGRTP